MINFAPLRTKRLSVRMREIAICDAIRLASVPPDRNEAATTEFLEKVLEAADRPTEQHVSDPRAWTVQERMLAVGHYLAHVSDTGPDFPVGENGIGKYSDYLNAAQDIGNFPILAGAVGGDEWYLFPLIGAAAECIEQLQGEVEGVVGRFHWLLGSMAAQLCLKDERIPDALVNAAQFSAWLKTRMEVLANYPESQFVEMLGMFIAGNEKIGHFFKIDVDGEGVLAMPAIGKEAEADTLPPARFPVSTCISEFAKRLSGKPAEYGG